MNGADETASELGVGAGQSSSVLFPPTDAEPWPPLAQGRYALALLILAFCFSFLDRVVLSMVMTPVQQDLSLSDIQLALLHGLAFSIFYAIAGYPLGRIADLHSRRKLIATGIAVWSLCTAACGLARGFGSLFLARVGVGVGEAALSPAAFSLLSDYFPPERRSRAIATYQLGVTGGSSIAYILGGLIIAFASGGAITLPLLGDMPPWRLTFFLVGLPGIFVALALLTIVEPKRRGSRAGTPVNIGPWLRANRRTFAYYICGYGCVIVAFNAVLAWGPVWLERAYGLSPATIGMTLGMAILLGGGSGQLLGAWRSDRALAAGHLTAVLDTGAGAALLLVPASLFAFASSLPMTVAALVAILFLTCAAIGHAPSLIGQIAPNELRGRLAALLLAALALLGGTLGPLAVAILTERLFGDPNMVGRSIGVTAIASALIGAFLLNRARASLKTSAPPST